MRAAADGGDGGENTGHFLKPESSSFFSFSPDLLPAAAAGVTYPGRSAPLSPSTPGWGVSTRTPRRDYEPRRPRSLAGSLFPLLVSTATRLNPRSALGQRRERRAGAGAGAAKLGQGACGGQPGGGGRVASR